MTNPHTSTAGSQLITWYAMLCHAAWLPGWLLYGIAYLLLSLLLLCYYYYGIIITELILVWLFEWMNEGIHLDLDTWIVPGQIRKANLCRGLGNRYTPAISNNNNNKRPLTPKSMPPAGDEHQPLVWLLIHYYRPEEPIQSPWARMHKGARKSVTI